MASTNTSSTDRLHDASQALIGAVRDRTIGAADRKVTGLTTKMESLAQNGGLTMPHVGTPPVKDALSGAATGVKASASQVKERTPGIGRTVSGLGSLVGGALASAKDKLPHPHLPGRGSDEDAADAGDADAGDDGAGDDGGSSGGDPRGSSTKVTTILEEFDVGVPVSLAYDQWTEFGSFPSFMKKVENVDAVEDQRLRWKAKIWWSHREWESTILEQIPEERIVWRSEGKKGHVDGAVTFHEVTPDLTRVIVVLEYHPQGLFEHTANLWRAQGRRVRAELQHFRRHVMAHAVLDPAQVNGWRGVIKDAEVVAEDEAELSDDDEKPTDKEGGEPEDEGEDQPEDQAEGEDQPEDQAEDDDETDEDLDDEQEPTDEADDQPEDRAEDQAEDEDVDQDEDLEDDAEPEDQAEDEDVEDEDDAEPEDQADDEDEDLAEDEDEGEDVDAEDEDLAEDEDDDEDVDAEDEDEEVVDEDEDLAEDEDEDVDDEETEDDDQDTDDEEQRR